MLNKTPADQLEEALRPILDVDPVLWFLALDNATINDDGYWTRASDYSLYRDPNGKFHIGPYDTNETFQPMGFGPGGFGKGGPGFGKGPKDGGFGKGPKDDDFKGPKDGFGFGKGPKGGGYALDPLIGVENPRMPLYRVLTVPKLRTKYLENMRTIASESLAWKKLKPVVEQYRTLIEKEIELDTRKLSSLTEFRAALSDDGGGRSNLRVFADGRSSYLLSHPEILFNGELAYWAGMRIIVSANAKGFWGAGAVNASASGNLTLTSPINVGDATINLSAATNLAIGQWISVQDGQETGNTWYDTNELMRITGIASNAITGFMLDPGPGDAGGARFAHASGGGGAIVTNRYSAFPIVVLGPNSITKAASSWTGPYGETVVTGPFDRLGRFLTFGWYLIAGYARTRNAWLLRGECGSSQT